VTGQEWLSCTDPTPMLEALRGTASERKLRLFAAACCRRIWRLLPGERIREAVEVAERYAEGGAGEADLAVARRLARLGRSAEQRAPGAAAQVAAEHVAGRRDGFARFAAAQAAAAAGHAAYEEDYRSTMQCYAMGGDLSEEARSDARESARRAREASGAAERAAQAALLRDIIGNPFRLLPSRTFPPHVVGLAESCSAAFPAVSGDFLVLADALDDLGEERAAAHCREPLHVKGCHTLDWILGKG